jgi:histidyl-tRNA synthetase
MPQYRRELLERCARCRLYGTRIKIDPSVVRGLEYYTGMVYEAELLFPVTNEKGEEVVFGSVGGGGRYDGLVSRFPGEPCRQQAFPSASRA